MLVPETCTQEVAVDGATRDDVGREIIARLWPASWNEQQRVVTDLQHANRTHDYPVTTTEELQPMYARQPRISRHHPNFYRRQLPSPSSPERSSPQHLPF